ncbi:MAG: vitamin B12-dependent ribonucleotide reductase, partial [bacterium]|nr:vitamin B12-dependent ribonucleotide reductase [bacterium]
SYDYRTLGLGYANIGSLLMTAGIPYDSAEAMAFAGTVTSLMTAESYITSAEMASFLGTFPKYTENREDMLRVMRNHRRATFNVSDDEYENLAVKPIGIDPKYAPAYLLAAARESWNNTVEMGERFGFRNAQTTLLAPTGTIGLLMDCSTTGVEPDFALVKFKKLAGGGYFKIVNEAVPAALKNLGYNSLQVQEIIDYMKGRATLKNSPAIGHENLIAKGLRQEEIDKVEKGLLSAFELQFAFNVWTLGEDCLKRLGFTSEQYNDPGFDLLLRLGFTSAEIQTANEYACGSMTVEGAPYLKPEHYAVFDTANRNGKKGVRYIHYLGHIRMMAAVQPYLSGAISKTINMPNEATLEDVKTAYVTSWKMGLKANAIYSDGSKMSQPLSSKGKEKNDKKEEKTVEIEVKKVLETKEEVKPLEIRQSQSFVLSNGHGHDHEVQQVVSDDSAQMSYAHDGTDQGRKIYIHGEQRKMPFKRSGLTIKSKVAGQKIFLRTGEYPDGKLGEVFIDMYKEGASFRSLLNLFAISISTGLQYGVPLEEYVEKFTFTRFEPSGMTDHPNVKFCTSMVDFVFRVIGMEYLGRTDFVQVKPAGIQKNRAEQMAKMAAEMMGQKTMSLPSELDDDGKDIEKEMVILKDQDAKNQMLFPIAVKSEVPTVADQQLSGMMGDAPPCPTCGHITIRSGSCYKCLNCGSTTGCS